MDDIIAQCTHATYRVNIHESRSIVKNYNNVFNRIS